ncbi:putative cyclic nucleotide-gated ion channel 20, chloroplastic [Glycine max]|nr:putative cyclic nucleotide-gated ion channel 20, chloroplastic [Glycine max]
MANFEKDEVPIFSDIHPKLSNELVDSKFPRRVPRTRSVSISIPATLTEPYERDTNLVGYTGPLRSQRKTPFDQMSGPLYVTNKPGNLFRQNRVAPEYQTAESKTENFPSCCGVGENDLQNNYAGKNEHLIRSGPLGMCNDPYCTTCPTYFKATQQMTSKASGIFNPKFRNTLYGDARDWARRLFDFLIPLVPRVMNPHNRLVQQWNKFFAICCLVAIFVDPLFFFLLSVQKDNKCIVINWPLTTALVLFRCVTDFVYFLNILLQFRLAYVSRESRVVGAGDLVDHPKRIALHYLKGYFLIDLFVVFPLPQIMILFVLPNSLEGANYAKNLLRAAILVQYIPKLFRFLPLLIGQSPTGFIFESAWANFIINLLIFMLASHVVGSCWYLFGLQRVNQCLRDACHSSNIPGCMKFIDCGRGHGKNQPSLRSDQWINNTDAVACLDPSPDGFSYGIYENAVPLTIETNIVNKYVYSLFWGFQQISTLAGNLEPSYFVWEVLFTMAIIGMGLLLFAILIGNIQNFLQALGRRKLEMQLRGRDVEQWMSHRRLPEDLRRRVRQAERYNWAATRGVNEEMLMENLPEDLQRDIRRHLFKFVKKIRLFALMDEPILDAICDRLRQKTYIKGSKILSQGGLVEKMVFVVRGKLESIGEDGTRIPLSEGDSCGEELLTWYLEHSSVSTDGRKVRLPGQRLVSNRTVRCLTNVESFSLSASDIEEVTILFTRFLRSPCVQGALRYESPYWRSLAATRIQVAWRYRKKRLSRKCIH